MISDTERDALFLGIEPFLQSTVTIWRRTVAANDDGAGETWAVIGTTSGLVTTTPTTSIVETANMAADVNTVRIILDRNASVSPGDRLEIGGRQYTVIDTTTESSLQIYMVCQCKALE